ncbi:MAG TPA: hypothetical protein VG889_21915 [Rhizomicrobium sp.]|nr:hypothetical protein [Rhizomicrobium sp.]
MIKRVASLAVLAGALAFAGAADAGTKNWKPMFVVGTNHAPLDYAKGHKPAGTLANWSGGFTDLHGHSVSYKMVGADPASSNTDTHIKTFIIPVIFVYGPDNGNMTFDPTVKKVNKKKNTIKSLLASPLFDNGADFKSGNIDCGQGQYIDVYQRCNFWSHVSTNTGYHTILDYTPNKKLKPLTINVSKTQGQVEQNEFTDDPNQVVGTYPYSTMDSQIGSYLQQHASQITPDTFPFFVSLDIYLTSGGCCIGGYHNARGQQTYGYTTYVDTDDDDGVFSTDISAASHEIGEWMDDPFVNNHVFCQDNSILENGDPLVKASTAYGVFPVKLNKFKYHPQSLVYLPYFGAPISTSANSWYSFQGPSEMNHTCPGQ